VDEVRKVVEIGDGLVDVFEFWEMRERALTMTPILELCLRSTYACSRN